MMYEWSGCLPECIEIKGVVTDQETGKTSVLKLTVPYLFNKTMRDAIAVEAIKGICARPMTDEDYHTPNHFDNMVEEAYLIADKMIQRSQR